MQSWRRLEGRAEWLACGLEAAGFPSWGDTLQLAAALGYIYLLCSENTRGWGGVVLVVVVVTQQNIS